MKKIRNTISLALAGLLILSGCKEDDFPVPPASTVPKFSYEISNDSYAPATVSFTNESIVPENAGTATFTWNFGDGKSSTEENPTHTYTEAGAYTVSLAVVTSSSLEIKNATKTIVIKDPNATGVEVFFSSGSQILSTFSSELVTQPIFTPLSGISLQSSYGVIVDTVTNTLYISDYSGGTISTANTDGSNFKTFRSGLESPMGMAIDYQEKQIYWTTNDAIERANLDDDNPNQKETFASGIANDPEGIAIDQENRRVYWSCYDGGLWRKNLDGTGETIIIPDVDGGSVVVAEGRIFYDEYVTGGDIHIKSADLNGSDIKTIATGVSRLTYGLAYDYTNGKIYWGDRNPGRIMRANTDGSQTQIWFEDDALDIRGIAFGKEN